MLQFFLKANKATKNISFSSDYEMNRQIQILYIRIAIPRKKYPVQIVKRTLIACKVSTRTGAELLLRVAS